MRTESPGELERKRSGVRPLAHTDDTRVRELFDERYGAILKRTDRLFAWLMIGQWLAAIGFAIWLSPYAWAGKTRAVHAHVFAAVILGGVISSLPVALAILQPGRQNTRYVVACGQMLWSALLIHLTGGRIETHFHVFGSLAILAFYRDLKVLVPATIVVALDHFVRGMVWPESVYGVANPEWWRFLEHAGWVVFIDAFLLVNCVQSYRELYDLCRQQVAIEEFGETALRMERLAAVGQLAASVGHELRNPLAAVRNAHAYLTKRMDKGSLEGDERVKQFLGIMDRELGASAKIISNLLDFARSREPNRVPCPLHPLIEEAIGLVPISPSLSVVNEVAAELPVPELDREQFRQIFVNLIQNAVEAMPADRQGTITIRAEADAERVVRLVVEDDGPGIPAKALAKIFQPLYSTKTKGTGLGLAVVAGIVERHGGQIRAENGASGGARFVIDLQAGQASRAA